MNALPFSRLTERTRPPANRQAQPQKRHVGAPRYIISAQYIHRALDIGVKALTRAFGDGVDIGMHQQLGTKVDQRGRKAEAIVLGHATQIGCALARADGEADAQRRGQGLGQ